MDPFAGARRPGAVRSLVRSNPNIYGPLLSEHPDVRKNNESDDARLNTGFHSDTRTKIEIELKIIMYVRVWGRFEII